MDLVRTLTFVSTNATTTATNLVAKSGNDGRMGKPLPLRRRKTSAEKARTLAAGAQSPLCNRDFAAQHGIALSTFYRWLQQFSHGQRSDRSHLIELPDFLSSAPTPRTYRVQLANGAVLEIASGFVREGLRASVWSALT